MSTETSGISAKASALPTLGLKRCKHCGREIKVIWSSHKFTIYVAPEQIAPGKAGAFCNSRNDSPLHELVKEP